MINCGKTLSSFLINRKFRSLQSLSKNLFHYQFTKIMASSSYKSIKDIRIPVSYGFIAAKTWGDKKAEPVLALHGWQDNAGTFDTLIPLLSSELYIVAIDAPGHGMSSHKPKGTFYHYMEILVDIERVVKYLRWETFSIIGHSLGGTIGLMYASVFPERVKNIVLLDIIKPASRDTDFLPDVTREGIEGLLKIEEKTLDPAPVYTLENAEARLVSGMHNQITCDSAKILLRRGCRPSDCGTGVVFSRDIRVKMTEDLQKLSHDDLIAFMKRVKCNLLIILGKDPFIYRSRTPEVLDDFLSLYEKNCKSFEVIRVHGNHFVHLNNPELVAPHIDNFFNSRKLHSKI